MAFSLIRRAGRRGVGCFPGRPVQVQNWFGSAARVFEELDGTELPAEHDWNGGFFCPSDTAWSKYKSIPVAEIQEVLQVPKPALTLLKLMGGSATGSTGLVDYGVLGSNDHVHGNSVAKATASSAFMVDEPGASPLTTLPHMYMVAAVALAGSSAVIMCAEDDDTVVQTGALCQPEVSPSPIGKAFSYQSPAATPQQRRQTVFVNSDIFTHTRAPVKSKNNSEKENVKPKQLSKARRERPPYSQDDARKAYEEYTNGLDPILKAWPKVSYKDIHKKYKISPGVMSKLVNGKSSLDRVGKGGGSIPYTTPEEQACLLVCADQQGVQGKASITANRFNEAVANLAVAKGIKLRTGKNPGRGYFAYVHYTICGSNPTSVVIQSEACTPHSLINPRILVSDSG